MGPLSIAIAFLPACAVHLGTVPPAAGWRVAAVEAPVVEAGVDEGLRRALDRALVARRATGDTPLTVRVTRADWSASGRSGALLLYTATLAVSVHAGAPFTVSASVERASPGDAASARSARAQAFADLADEVAQRIVGNLVLAPSPR